MCHAYKGKSETTEGKNWLIRKVSEVIEKENYKFVAILEADILKQTKIKEKKNRKEVSQKKLEISQNQNSATEISSKE